MNIIKRTMFHFLEGNNINASMPFFSPIIAWRRDHAASNLALFLKQVSDNMVGKDSDAILDNFSKIAQENIHKKSKIKDLILIKSVLNKYESMLDEILMFNYKKELAPLYQSLEEEIADNNVINNIIESNYESRRAFLEEVVVSISNQYNMFIQATKLGINEVSSKVERKRDLDLSEFEEAFLTSLRSAIAKKAVFHFHAIEETVNAKQHSGRVKPSKPQKIDKVADSNSEDEFEEVFLTPNNSVGYQNEEESHQFKTTDKLKNTFLQIKQKWSNLPLKWKIAAGAGLLVGGGLIVAGAVAFPPSLAITVPVVGKIAVSSVAVGAGVAMLTGTLTGHALHVGAQQNQRDEIGYAQSVEQKRDCGGKNEIKSTNHISNDVKFAQNIEKRNSENDVQYDCKNENKDNQSTPAFFKMPKETSANLQENAPNTDLKFENQYKIS